MYHMKAVLNGLILSCAVLSIPIVVDATIIETKTFKNTAPGGNAATDLKLTLNRRPDAAKSDKFTNASFPASNAVTFTGGSLGQGGSTTVTITFGGNDRVEKNAASFSFANGPDVPITSPIVGELGGQIPVGGGLHGFLQLTNDSGTPLFFSNFQASVNVPGGLFSDVTSDTALQTFTDNNLFINQGTPVSLPSTFSLAAGEIRDFDLGPILETNFFASFFDVGFSLGIPDTTFGIAAQGVIPEPSTFLLLASGLVGLARQLWRRRT
jgi:hypothetical protein